MSTESDCIDVAVGLIINPEQEVLLAQRHDHAHQGGLWEFPGGKRDPNESIEDALRRELEEEIGISVRNASPLIQIQHDYSDRAVKLHVFNIDSYDGIAHGSEGQAVRWQSLASLKSIAMPAANAAIVQAILLPDMHLITPEPENFEDFLKTLQRCLQSGIRLIQYRDKLADDAVYKQRLMAILKLTRAANAQVMVNHSLSMFQQMKVDGLHLTAEQLTSLDSRPVSDESLLSASCHNLEEIRCANKIGTDFIMLSPVLPTLSHPGARTLGWQNAQELIWHAQMPVYVLGGMNPDDIPQARRVGAQGIAGIRSVWTACQ